MKDVWELLGAGHREALEAAQGLAATPGNLERVARKFGVDAARWAFEQWDLRKRARAKFEKAEKMLFDRDGLEVATHEALAWVHPMAFPPKVRAADLTVGIGADLIALARTNKAVGFEIDPLRAAMARRNLAIHGLEAEIRVANCLESEWDFEYAIADPMRRSQGRRVRNAEDYEPPLEALATRMGGLKGAAIKVSPLLSDETLSRLADRIEFVSFGGECREAILRLGDLGQPSVSGSVLAFHAETQKWLVGGDEFLPVSEVPDAILFEADPAAIRAHALADLGGHLGATALGESNGYLTGPHLASDLEGRSFARAYHVLESGHADAKRIRQELRELGGTVEAVKVRGVREDPRAWQAKLKTEGLRKLVLILYPVGKSVRYALVEPT